MYVHTYRCGNRKVILGPAGRALARGRLVKRTEKILIVFSVQEPP